LLNGYFLGNSYSFSKAYLHRHNMYCLVCIIIINSSSICSNNSSGNSSGSSSSIRCCSSNRSSSYCNNRSDNKRFVTLSECVRVIDWVIECLKEWVGKWMSGCEWFGYSQVCSYLRYMSEWRLSHPRYRNLCTTVLFMSIKVLLRWSSLMDDLNDLQFYLIELICLHQIYIYL